MKRMSDDKLEAIIQNEQEWRRVMFRKIESIEEENKKIHGKITGLSGFISVIGGFFASILHKKIGG